MRKRTAFSKEEKLFSYEKSIHCIMRHCWFHDWKVFVVKTVKLIACEGKSDNFNFYSQYLTRVFEVPLPWVFSACYPCGRNGMICKEKRRGHDEKQTRRERVRQRLITCRELRIISQNAGATRTLYIWNRANCSIWIDFKLMDFTPSKIADFSLTMQLTLSTDQGKKLHFTNRHSFPIMLKHLLHL